MTYYLSELTRPDLEYPTSGDVDRWLARNIQPPVSRDPGSQLEYEQQVDFECELTQLRARVIAANGQDNWNDGVEFIPSGAWTSYASRKAAEDYGDVTLTRYFRLTSYAADLRAGYLSRAYQAVTVSGQAFLFEVL